MAVEIGALRALLSLDSAAFEKGAKRAQASMNGLQRSLKRSADQMRRVGKTMSTRVTAPFVAATGLMLRNSLKTVDAQSKMAQSLGTSTRSMQVLARAADRAGISTGELEQVGRQLTKRLSQAATGAGPAAKSLQRLGLSAADLVNLDLDQRIAVINKAIAETVPAAEQAAVAATIFGDRAGLLASRLDASTIAAANEEIERFGIAVTEIEADKIEEANDAMSALGLVVVGLGNQMAVALAPILKDIAVRIADVAAWFADLSPRMQRFAGITAVVAAGIGPLAIALGFIATGLAALASPVGLVILGLGALAAAAAYVVTEWDNLVAKYPGLQTALETVSAVAKAVWPVFAETGKAAFDIAAGYISVFAAALRGDLSGALEASEGISRRFIEYIETAFPGVIGTINDVISDTVEAGREIIDGIAQGITDGISRIGAALDELVTVIIDWLRDLPGRVWDNAVQAGSDIIDGLVSGILSQRSKVGSAGRNAGRAVIDGVRKETETQSPSRAFMRIGEDLMAGLGVGIADNAQAAAAQAAEAAARVTDAAGGAMDDGRMRINSFFDSFGDAAAGAITDGENFASSMRDIFQRLARDLLAAGISNILKSIFSGGGQGGAGTGSVLGNIFKTIFGGFRAAGGPVAPGRAYVVGETGPELFAPGVAGTIVPNGGMGGAAQRVAVEVFVNDDGTLGAIAHQAGAMGGAAVAASQRKTFARDVQAVMGNSRLRGR